MKPRGSFPPVLLTLALAACAAGSNPEVDLAAEEAAVRAASAGLVAAEASRDLEGALSYWSADAILHLEGSPPIQGPAGLREAYEMFLGDTTMVSFEGTPTALHVAASGDLAWEHGVNRFQFQGPAGLVEAVGKYIGVWRKTDAGWKVAAVAVTNDAPMQADTMATP